MKFDFYFIEEITELFPYDVTNQLDPNKVLKMEFVEKEINNEVLKYAKFDDLKSGHDTIAMK